MVEFDTLIILSACSCSFFPGRIRSFVCNRYDGEEPADVVCAVICSIKEENYYKTDELEKIPGQYADIYSSVECEEYPEEPWYVKLFVEDGMM